MTKIVLIIFLTILISFFLADKIIKNLFKNHRHRYLASALLVLLFLFSIFLARHESFDSGTNGKYIPPYYDGKKVNPGKIEYEK